ncbi:hypothetical protein [Pseudomonas sp. PK-RTE-24]
MSNHRLFHDYHLPNGVGLATNPSNDDSENRNIESILEGIKSDISNDQFAHLIRDYERSLSSIAELNLHHLSFSSHQKMYGLLNPFSSRVIADAVRNSTELLSLRKKPKSSEDDKADDAVHTEGMTDISRDELKAHLENQDLKVDARLGKFEQRVSDGLTEMNHSLQLLDKDLAGLRGLKGTIILNSVLSVIAVVGIVIAVMAYGTSSFDSGRDTAQLLQELRQQSFENKQMLEQIKANQTPSK